MSQFRKYFVAELKGIPSVPMTHRTKPAFADHDINWEYFEVIEVAALEAAQKEIAELKTEIKGWMQKASQQEQSIVDWENYVAREKSENHKLTAALKVAEDALEEYKKESHELDQVCCNYWVQVGEQEWACCDQPITKAEKAQSEIQKIKKGLG